MRYIYMSRYNLVVAVIGGNDKTGWYQIAMKSKGGLYNSKVHIGPGVKLVTKEEHPEYFL